MSKKSWTNWYNRSLAPAVEERVEGVYIIATIGQILYVGQGKIKHRLEEHFYNYQFSRNEIPLAFSYIVEEDNTTRDKYVAYLIAQYHPAYNGIVPTIRPRLINCPDPPLWI